MLKEHKPPPIRRIRISDFGLPDSKRDPDRHQNCITWSLSHALPSKKFRQNPFTSLRVIRRTDRRTDRQTDLTKNITSFFGGGNNNVIVRSHTGPVTEWINFPKSTPEIAWKTIRKPLLLTTLHPFTTLLLLHSFNGLFSRTTWVSRHQKGRTILYSETILMEWQWHQLNHVQTIHLDTDR